MNSFLKSINKVLQRDLEKLETEIASYPDTASLWVVRGDIKNPAGNLCLHLCGNLRHFIGVVLGKSDFVRDREKEFSLRNLPVEELLSQISATRKIVAESLTALNPSVLDTEYPIRVFDEPMSTEYFLIHLAGHLNYHLGQINYHRRITAVR